MRDTSQSAFDPFQDSTSEVRDLDKVLGARVDRDAQGMVTVTLPGCVNVDGVVVEPCSATALSLEDAAGAAFAQRRKR